MSLSEKLLLGLWATTLKTLVDTLKQAKDDDGTPAQSLVLELDMTDGETYVVTVTRAKTTPDPLTKPPT